MKIDPTIYYAHGLFWGAFAITRLALRRGEGEAQQKPATAVAGPIEKAAPFSKALLAFHMVAFAIMYQGIWLALISGRIPRWMAGQDVVGFLLILSGAGLAVWALVYFRSWRFRAKIDTGHQLATGGPFKLLRHPIYMALNLLALGSAVWIPTPWLWTGFVLMVIGSDLRARSEEKLLEQVFGDSYRTYRAQTRRFIAGIY